MREGVERLALPVDGLAVLVGDVLGRVAVDLLEHLDHVRLFGVVSVLEARREESLVPLLLGADVELLEPLRERAHELGVRGDVPGRARRPFVPLDQPHRVRQRPVLLGGRRRRHEEDLGLDVLGIGARRLPHLGRLGQEDVLDDEPVEALHGGAGELGVGAADRGVLAEGEEPLDHAVVHVHEDVLMAVRVRRRAFGQPLVAELVVLRRRVAVERLEQAHEELGFVDPEAALRRLLLHVGREVRMGVA